MNLSALFAQNGAVLPALSGGTGALMQSAVSAGTQVVEKNMRELLSGLAPSMLVNQRVAVSLNERLLDARVTAKQLIASVAMHIDPHKRVRLFDQLDSIHDPDEWMAGDTPLLAESFSTFLRAMFELSPAKHPSIGLSHDGHLLAAWGNSGDRLTIEFLPRRRARWSLTRPAGGQIERAVGESNISRLGAVLAPYEPLHWFGE